MRSGLPRVLLVHPGTQHSYQLARQLARLGALKQFWTGLAIRKEGALHRLAWPIAGDRIRRALANRLLDGVPAGALVTRPLIELAALLKLRAGVPIDAVMHERNQRFQKVVSNRALAQASVVVGFDTAAWILGERARAANVPFILDRTAPPEPARDVFAKLRHDFPEWAEDMRPENPRVLEAERIEHARAACIVVASSHTRRRLIEAGVEAAKIAVIPYGVDSDAFAPRDNVPAAGRIRFVFVGAVNARKGVPLLLTAWRSLGAGAGEVTIVGSVSPKVSLLLARDPDICVLGKVPHGDLPEIYAANDVLVFPSYFEGFGLVILEAMAAGLPVITTDATAGPDLLAEGVEGFVVPAGDADALAARMRLFVDNRAMARQMGAAARAKARQFTWDAYGDAWLRLLGKERLLQSAS